MQLTIEMLENNVAPNGATFIENEDEGCWYCRGPRGGQYGPASSLYEAVSLWNKKNA